LAANEEPREVIQPRWGVYLLKRKVERLSFTVTGRNSEEAIKRAIKGIRPARARTLPHQRVAGGLGRRLPRSYLTLTKHPTEMVRLACTC
jgi:hypothetical protein